MIPYRPIHEISLGPITIKVWGLFVALGLATALVLALRRAKLKGIKQAWVYDIIFYSIVAGLIGSRIGYVLFSWPNNVPRTLLSILDITKGGLAFTFGLVAALFVDIAYIIRKKIRMLSFLDFFVPYLVIAHIIGRMGCFFSGEHLGKQTDFFLGVLVNGVVVHNVAMYEIIILLAILSTLLYIRRFALPDGMLFAAYLALYPLLRFPIDFLRSDPTYFGLTAAQYVLIAMFVSSIILKVYIQKHKK